MDLPRSSHFAWQLLFACLALITAGIPALAQQPVSQGLPPSQLASIQLTVTQQPNPLLHLEARAAPLAQILKAIADKTGVNIHYSVLPEAPVTATCIGANVGQVMDCLVAKQVGLVAHKAQKDKPAEFWLLGSSVGSCQAVSLTSPLPPKQEVVVKPTAEALAEMERQTQEQTNEMLKQAHSKDPNERYSAINNLGAMGSKDDPNVDQVLRDALADKDTNVRVQAIASIVQRGGDDIADQLGRALQDKEPNVRMSIINVAKDITILQQALNDNDQAVRELAQIKLDELEKIKN
jgi:HEAT repeat protein